MKGFMVVFFTQQNRRYKGKMLGDWVVDLAKDLGLRGATLSTGIEGHSACRLLPGPYIGDRHESKISISQGEPTNRRRTKLHHTERQLADGFP